MAKGTKTGGRDIKPGQVLNPLGGGAITPVTRALRKITMEHIEQVADVILDGDLDGLRDIAESRTHSVLQVWLAKAAVVGIDRGDIGPLETILNRTLGKPKERHELTGKDGAPLGHLSDEEVERRYQELIAKGKP